MFSADVSVQTTLRHLLALESKNAGDVLLTSHLNKVPLDLFGDVRSVSAEEVRNAAKAVLKSNPAYAVMGATAELPTFEHIKAQWHKA